MFFQYKRLFLKATKQVATHHIYHGGGFGSKFDPKRRNTTLMSGANMFAISTVGLILPMAKPIPICEEGQD